ncbi:sigma-70 family RNA polymerase sigma factor [Acidaminococcus fermentans]|nr:sigma-70 family RNA polymerase sigma factor [Acidaminococcus fermentans]
MENEELAALLPQAKQGDPKAQMAIVTAFRPLVKKLAGQEKNLSLRPDLASTLVLGILEAIVKYPGEDARRFLGFVKTHLTFLLSHYIRKEARWNKIQEKVQVMEGGESSYQEDFLRGIRKEEILRAFRQLTPKERLLVRQAAIQQIPWKKLQEIHQCPLSTLYGWYRKALEKMKRGE